MLALFILVKPGIQVKLVKDAAPTELDERHVQFGKQRNPDPEIRCRLFPGQATSSGQWQAVVVHVTRRPLPYGIAVLLLHVRRPVAFLPASDRSVRCCTAAASRRSFRR